MTKVLGIETSCDETAVAIIDSGKKILSHVISSQIDLHREFGGVVPELAARSHAQILDEIILKACIDANLSLEDIDAFAATAGPGLIGGVIVGLMAGKSLSSIYQKPFLAVNHLAAHALTIRLTHKVQFPYLSLLVSGGHCQILLVQDVNKYKKIGQTIDDALGEAFDKVAQMLGLSYPGGPEIEKRAKKGNAIYDLPRPLLGDKDHQFNFSFSGLKTAVRRLIENLTKESFSHNSSPKKLTQKQISDICASFQKSCLEITNDRLRNVIHFLEKDNQLPKNLVIAGGVAANQFLYRGISDFITKFSINTLVPDIKLCTDNAAMVAWAGVEKLNCNLIDGLGFSPKARWDLTEISPSS